MTNNNSTTYASPLSVGATRGGKVFVDLRGQTFGVLRVLGKAIRPGRDRELYWVCQCECGRFVYSTSNHLRTGIVWHCGCLSNRSTSRLVIPDISKVKLIQMESVPDKPGFAQLVGYKRRHPRYHNRYVQVPLAAPVHPLNQTNPVPQTVPPSGQPEKEEPLPVSPAPAPARVPALTTTTTAVPLTSLLTVPNKNSNTNQQPNVAGVAEGMAKMAREMAELTGDPSTVVVKIDSGPLHYTLSITADPPVKE